MDYMKCVLCPPDEHVVNQYFPYWQVRRQLQMSLDTDNQST